MPPIGVSGITVGVAHVAHANADPEPIQWSAVPGVVSPGSSLVARHLRHALAFLVTGAFDDFAVVVGVRAHQFEVLGHIRGSLQLQAFYAHFAYLAGDTTLGHRHVLLCQVEHSSGEQAIAAWRLVLDAQFVLLAFGRFEGIGAVDGGTGGSLERLGIGDVRRQAVIEYIAESCVTTELLVALGVGCVALIVEGGAGVHPVLTATKGQAPVVQRHLVLDIQAGLLGFLVVVVHVEVLNVREILTVDGVVDIARWHTRRAPAPAGIAVRALVVEPQQQGMGNLPGLEVGLEVVVQGEL